MSIPRHCEERSDAAIQNASHWTGLPRFARNDERLRAFAPSREPNPFFDSREAAKTRRGFGLQRFGHILPTVEII